MVRLDHALGEHITLTSGNIPDDIVVEADIGVGAITATELATDAVETVKIKDVNVTAAKLATDSVETLKIKDLNVTNAKLAAATIESAKIDYFKSSEITGTGSDQNIAHGLGRTPALVFWATSLTGDTDTVVEGATDGTNVVLDFPATTKLFVIAL